MDSERRCSNVRRAQTEVNTSSYLMLFPAIYPQSEVIANLYLMLFDAVRQTEVNSSSYFDNAWQTWTSAIFMFDPARCSVGKL